MTSDSPVKEIDCPDCGGNNISTEEVKKKQTSTKILLIVISIILILVGIFVEIDTFTPPGTQSSDSWVS